MLKVNFFNRKNIGVSMLLFIKKRRMGGMRVALSLSILAVLLAFSACGSLGGKKDTLAENTVPDDEAMMANSAIQKEIRSLSTLPDSLQNGISSKDYAFVINELTYEVKRLGAEVKHLTAEVDEMKTKSQMLENPLKIYNKEIILNNGTSVYGKIIFQDSKSIKVETLIGYLIIDRKDIVRIVENFPEVEEKAEPAAAQPTAPPVVVQEAVPTATAFSEDAVVPPTANTEQGSANCILVDNIREVTDKSGNRTFSGTVRNIGTRRADFVKINMVFRTNWSGGTKTLTAFVKGSYFTYSSGIASDNALLPGASGKFNLVIPGAFGTFIGYTYNVDWETYD